MKKEMLINVLQPEECRIAILEDGVLEELYVERTSHESYVGNIYKGRIVNIEPSIQAAFVDFGVGRNGFLHVSDVEPTYYRHLEPRRGDRGDRGDRGGRRGRDRDRDRDRDRPRRPMEYEVEDLDRSFPEELAPLDEAATLLPDEAALEVQRAEEVVEITDAEPGREEETHSEEITGEATAEEASAESSRDTGSPVTALPETRIEEEPTRRRRSRGRSRSPRKAAAAESGAEAMPSQETQPPSPLESSEASSAEESERPRFMDSAERRTTEQGSRSHVVVGRLRHRRGRTAVLPPTARARRPRRNRSRSRRPNRSRAPRSTFVRRPPSLLRRVPAPPPRIDAAASKTTWPPTWKPPRSATSARRTNLPSSSTKRSTSRAHRISSRNRRRAGSHATTRTVRSRVLAATAKAATARADAARADAATTAVVTATDATGVGLGRDAIMAGPASGDPSRSSRTFSSAARKCSSRSSRRASAPRGRP